ncbi:MAG: hypothetical protein HN542_00155 [Flavobacteriales bacterium]|nr:hypothetical protein [Flavobacteriales bacterium]MBT3964019.1 hypothetical protein [Flavobacteriales bacterium]MBT4704517.1 hypothetical protein [Flavobacteriales bacterium]MBT4931272.1 hypothetical protein [Flavobacteriales bacterium]MBT5131899.1 hypothetical protein [Flavobacteriales bacterium]
MRHSIIIALFITYAFAGIAQDSVSTDSIPIKPKAGFISNVMFQFDNRNERYFDVTGRMNGLKLGLEFYKRFRTGFGFYGNNDFYNLEPPETNDTLAQSVKFNYRTYFGEVVFYRNFRWELSAMGAFGNGEIELNNFDISGQLPEFKNTDTIRDVSVIDFGINVQYKIFPWFGVGVGVGQRNVKITDEPILQDAFTDPYLDFKIKVFLGYLYRTIFKPEVIEAEKEYYKYRDGKRTEAYRKLFDKK